jgi:hypothetical protein
MLEDGIGKPLLAQHPGMHFLQDTIEGYTRTCELQTTVSTISDNDPPCHGKCSNSHNCTFNI